MSRSQSERERDVTHSVRLVVRVDCPGVLATAVLPASGQRSGLPCHVHVHVMSCACVCMYRLHCVTSELGVSHIVGCSHAPGTTELRSRITAGLSAVLVTVVLVGSRQVP